MTGISAVIFDEFHERHLYGDITLARALQLQETRAARPEAHRHVRHARHGPSRKIPRAVRDAAIGGTHAIPWRSSISQSPTATRTIRSGKSPRSELERLVGGDRRRRADLHAGRIRDQPHHPGDPALARLRLNSSCCRSTANCPSPTQDAALAALLSSARSSSPPTSRRPRSPSTACAW